MYARVRVVSMRRRGGCFGGGGLLKIYSCSVLLFFLMYLVCEMGKRERERRSSRVLSVCMCVCVYVRVRACMRLCVWGRLCTCTCICIYLFGTHTLSLFLSLSRSLSIILRICARTRVVPEVPHTHQARQMQQHQFPCSPPVLYLWEPSGF